MAADTQVVHEIIIDTDQAEKATKKLGASFKTFAKIGAAAVVGVGAGLLKLGSDFAKTTDRIDKLSKQLGFSTQAFQEWDFITSQSGTSMEELRAGMKTLTNQTDDLAKGGKIATESFGALGIGMEDLEGLTPEEIFEKTIKALQGVEDETKRAALANDLLGRSGQSLAPLLAAGTTAIDDMKQQASELGLVIEEETIQQGVELTDKFDQVKRAFKAATTSASSDLIPALIGLADLLIEDVLPAVTNFVKFLVDIPGFIKENKTQLQLLGVVIGTLTTLVLAYNIQQAIAASGLGLWATLAGIATTVTTGLAAAFAFLTSPISLIIIGIGLVVAGFILLIKFKDPIINFFKKIGEGIQKFFINTINFAIKGLNALIRLINKIPGINIGEVGQIGGTITGGQIDTSVIAPDRSFSSPGEQTRNSISSRSVNVERIEINAADMDEDKLVDRINMRLGEQF